MWFDLFSISYFYWLAVSSLSPEVSGTLGGERRRWASLPQHSMLKRAKSERTLLIQGPGDNSRVIFVPDPATRTEGTHCQHYGWGGIFRNGQRDGHEPPSASVSCLHGASCCLPAGRLPSQFEATVCALSTSKCPWARLPLAVEEIGFGNQCVPLWESGGGEDQDGKWKYNPNCFSFSLPSAQKYHLSKVGFAGMQ